MASKQSGAVTLLYQSWLASTGEDDLIQGPDDWDILATEPGGVDYLETDAAGVPAMWAVPKGAAQDRVLMCIHGGGFISGSIYTHRKLFAHLAKAAGVRALIVGYRILPEGVHPAPVEDVVTAYRWLLAQSIPADQIAFTGDSAGGGLAVTAQLVARDLGLVIRGSPRSTVTSAGSARSISRSVVTSCCSTTAAGSPTTRGWRELRSC